MEKDKQRNQKTRRRERAQRMQAEKRQTLNSKNKDCDSAEDDLPLKEKPKRPPPPNRRKKTNNNFNNNFNNNNNNNSSNNTTTTTPNNNSNKNNNNNNNNSSTNSSSSYRNTSNSVSNCNIKECLFEEDIIDGFSIFSFVNYDDLENSLNEIRCGKVTLGVSSDGSKLLSRTSDEQNPGFNNHITKAKIPSSPQSSQLHNNSNSSCSPPEFTKKGSSVGNKLLQESVTSTIASTNGRTNVTPSSTSAVMATSPESGVENACIRIIDGMRDKPVQRTSSPLRDQRASSHERLSDISSRCSSEKGYMCDSEGDEGDDDKESSGDSVSFSSPHTSFKRELRNSGITSHVPTNLFIGNANVVTSNERLSPCVHPSTMKSQIRVVTPPLRYSPNTAQKPQQQPQPLPPSLATASSLPFSTHLSSLSSNIAHHASIGQTSMMVDQHGINKASPSSLQHHFTPSVSQSQPLTTTSFPTSQHSLPHNPHSQYSPSPAALTMSSSHYPAVMNGGLQSTAPPQAHSVGHPVHISHPVYQSQTPHHLMTSTSSPMPAAAIPVVIATSTVPVCATQHSATSYMTTTPATARTPTNFSISPQICPLPLSVTNAYSGHGVSQPPAAHSTNTYVPSYASPLHPAVSHLPYGVSTHTGAVVQAPPVSQAYPPHITHMAQPSSPHHPHPGAVHSIPNSHFASQHHVPHNGQHIPTVHQPSHLTVSSHAISQLPPHPPAQMTSVYNHVSPQISTTYTGLPYSRSAMASCITSENNNAMAVAGGFAVPSHNPSTSSFPSLYAPYSSTPYLPSHSRASRSPLSVISSKSTVSNVSASATSLNVSASSTTLVVATTTVTTSHRDYATTPLVNRSHSPRGHSPTRERDSYSSNVSSLSRGSVHTPISNSSPFSIPPVPVAAAQSAHVAMPVSIPVASSVPVSSSLNLSNKPSIWGPVGSGVITSNAVAAGVPPPAIISRSLNSFVPPIFTSTTSANAAVAVAAAHPVVAPPVAVSSLHPAAPHTVANSFSAESLFQSSKADEADLLRRELDSRFLATQERSLVTAATAPPPPYLRTEMHHHQHQHTHVHQHTASLLPPPPATALYPPSAALFKDIPKLGGVESPFYRQALGLPNYPAYPSTMLHPTLGAATPFAPPTHLPTFTPKQVVDSTKPKPVKPSGKWNAMHVRIAWEIYHHQQQKQQTTDMKPNKNELLNRTPSHLFPTPPRAPHELSPFSTPHRPPGTAFEAAQHGHPANPYVTLGNNVFARYQPTPYSSLAQYSPSLHDSWARLQARTVQGLGPTAYPSPLTPAWNIKPEPGETVDRERERERERNREREREREKEREREREREKERERSKERDRMRREEKQRRLLVQQQVHQQQQQAAAVAVHQQQQQQHQHHQAQQQAQNKNLMRDRSPLRDSASMLSQKEEEMYLVGRQLPYLRHPSRPLPPPPQFTPWDPYRYDPTRYPFMTAFREDDEQRGKLYGAYGSASPPATHLRKEASPSSLHLRPDLHLKKDESSQSR